MAPGSSEGDEERAQMLGSAAAKELDMLDNREAGAIASKYVPAGLALNEWGARELREGWLFPFRPATDELASGSNGLIIHRQTGRVLLLGSAFPLERDAQLYDLGYQFERYDLVVTEITDIEQTLATLMKLGMTTTTPEFKHGTIWRVPQPIDRPSLESSLARLPHVFPHLHLYFVAEHLEEARALGAFQFELLACGCGCSS